MNPLTLGRDDMLTTLVLCKDLHAFLSFSDKYLYSNNHSIEYRFINKPEELEGFHPPYGLIILENFKEHKQAIEIRKALRRILSSV